MTTAPLDKTTPIAKLRLSHNTVFWIGFCVVMALLIVAPLVLPVFWRRFLTEVLICILRHLDNRWLELVTLGFAALRDAWRERSLLTGRAVQLRVGAEMLTGRCLGIDDDGALLLQTEQGRHTCHAGSVVAFE